MNKQILFTNLMAISLTVVGLGLTQSGCLDPSTAVPVGAQPGALANNNSTSPTSASTDLSSYTNAGSVKVVFNKKNFYNNYAPNGYGCPGDAHYYYSPMSDRQVPAKPNFVKNISLDLTNTNALYGPSQATGCSLTGLGAANAANCASFDDLQPLSGATSRTIMVGGIGCLFSGCSSVNNVMSDIWSLTVSDISTASLWANQTATLPAISGVAGLSWAAGGYDELHDQFYLFGGATPSSTAKNGPLVFSSNILQLQFSADGSLSTSPAPQIITPLTRKFYGGWAKAGAFDATLPLNPPSARVGSTFTYGFRRDPAGKSLCTNGSAIGSFGTTCTSSTLSDNGINKNLIAINEHSDYFLLVGGMDNAGTIKRDVYMYKPHNFSNDTGATGTSIGSGGDWNLLSNITTAPTIVSNQIMSIVDIAPNSSSGSSLVPYVPTFAGSTRPDGTTFNGWLGRAFHRSVYDPVLNRYYIFGGIQNNSASSSSVGNPATTTAPDIATNDLWVYDPPAIGRRPTAGCFTTQTPDAVTLPAYNSVTGRSELMGASLNLDLNRQYISNSVVFPPGGCLQRIGNSPSTNPASRFEHSMAFDRDQKSVLLFGGCTKTATIVAGGVNNAGNPLNNCTANALKSDTWLFLPPTVNEFVDADNFRVSYTSPYNSSTLLANIFGTNFWLNQFPLFYNNNNPSAGAITKPANDEVLGSWIYLTPSESPPPRASGALTYDRAHHKYYLQGGYGCIDSACSSGVTYLSDLWEFTPPNIDAYCSRSGQSCSNQGSWKKLKAHTVDTGTTQPTARAGAFIDYAQPMFSYGDDYYTVLDSACINQGPIASGDSSVNKRYVGAVYVEIDSAQLKAQENILLNLRFMPFDQYTKAPSISDNGTAYTSSDDSDASSVNDTALLRVQIIRSPFSSAEQIQSSVQPRFHEMMAGSRVIADTFSYLAGPSGQVSERQIVIPASALSQGSLIKIERVQGSIKFYEMIVSKY